MGKGFFFDSLEETIAKALYYNVNFTKGFVYDDLYQSHPIIGIAMSGQGNSQGWSLNPRNTTPLPSS